MNCRICGCPLEEGALYCSNCGAKAEQNESAFSDAAASDPGQYGGDGISPQASPVSDSPLWQGVRKTLGSQVFLATVILLTLQLGLQILDSLAGKGDGQSDMVSLFLGWIPMILFVIGAWQLRSSSRSSEPLEGLGLIRGASIIIIVLNTIALIVLCLAMFPVIDIMLSEGFDIGSANYKEAFLQFSGGLGTGFVVFGLAGIVFLAIAMVALSLTYYIKISALVKTIREIDGTGLQSRPVSSYLNFYHMANILLIVIGAVTGRLFAQKVESYLAQMNLEVEYSLFSIVSDVVGWCLYVAMFLTIRKLKKNLQQEA